LKQPAFLAIPVEKPLDGPHAMKSPAELTQHGMSQALAVSNSCRADIGITIALNTQQVRAVIIRVANSEFKPITATANISIDFIAVINKKAQNL
jgi:tRNA pseudouridine-54 N-methylase